MIQFRHGFKVLSTPGFDGWLDSLGDLIGAAHIKVRHARVRDGHWGDCVSLGEGLFELRIHRGPGYRIYLTRLDSAVLLFLMGGDKSTQQADIRVAKILAQKYREDFV
jgi:putative addiction module killer protein